MFIYLRITSILFDILLANILFYRKQIKKNRSNTAVLFLLICFLFHIGVLFLFSESRIFLISNVFFTILDYYFVGLYYGYTVRTTIYWIFLETSLTLLAGAVLNQAVQLYLPLTKVSGNSAAIISYLAVNFLLSAGVTFILRRLFIGHQKLTFSEIGEKWFYQFFVPLLLIFFTFTLSAIQGQIFRQVYLSFVSLLSLLFFSIFYLYITLHLSQQHQRFYKNKLEKEQLQFQLREIKHSQEEYQRLQRLRHDLKNKHLTLLSLLNENPEQAKSYLHSLTDSIEDVQKCYSKNPIINFLLNQKLNNLEDEIKFEINCFVPQALSIPPDVLAVILGNCLDNSIAACLRLTNVKNRKLNLDLRFFQHRLYISISNTFNEQEQLTRQARYTEGWGLRNIELLVQEYQGNVKHFIKDGWYITEIFLQIEKELI